MAASDQQQTPPDSPQTFPSYCIGFRTFQVRSGGLLGSTGIGNTTWRPGTNIAYCSDHLAPDPDCESGCGLYFRYGPGGLESGSCHAVCAARGELLAHHSGFRAEEAQILAISPGVGVREGSYEWLQLQQVADRYQVPLVPFEALEEVAAGYGQAPERPEPAPPSERQLKRNGLIVFRSLRREQLDWHSSIAALVALPLLLVGLVFSIDGALAVPGTGALVTMLSLLAASGLAFGLSSFFGAQTRCYRHQHLHPPACESILLGALLIGVVLVCTLAVISPETIAVSAPYLLVSLVLCLLVRSPAIRLERGREGRIDFTA